MGQAKLRGTFEQRKEQAIKTAEANRNLINRTYRRAKSSKLFTLFAGIATVCGYSGR